MSSGAHKSKVNERNRRLPTWRDEAVRAIFRVGNTGGESNVVGVP
jgi:hypothetical protein